MTLVNETNVTLIENKTNVTLVNETKEVGGSEEVETEELAAVEVSLPRRDQTGTATLVETEDGRKVAVVALSGGETATDELVTSVVDTIVLPVVEVEEEATEEMAEETGDDMMGPSVILAEGEDIVIGFAAAMTGEGLDPLGIDINRGVELALEDRPTVTVDDVNEAPTIEFGSTGAATGTMSFDENDGARAIDSVATDVAQTVSTHLSSVG